MRRLGLFVRREMGEAVRSRWFAVYAAILLVGGVLLIGLGARDTLLSGYRGYARALGGLVHFAVLFVPLMALVPAAGSIAEERENGTLEYLLAQPITRGEVFLGKWVGIALAVAGAITAGYLLAGGLAVLRGVPVRFVAISYGYLLLLALAFVSLGMALSAVSETRARAITIGLFAWLAFIALGAFVRWGMPAGPLVAWTFVNPAEAFRLGMVALIDPDLGLLGPVGGSLATRIGSDAILWRAAGSLALWAAVPLGLGAAGWLRRREGA